MLKYLYENCNMGGYGVYIWLSYGLAIVLLTAYMLRTLRKSIKMHAKIKHELWQTKDNS